MQDHRKLPRAVVKGLANLLPSRNVGSVARSADHPTGTQENGSTASPRFSLRRGALDSISLWYQW